MKTIALLNAIIAFGLASAVSGTRLSYAEAEAICGDLGVMSVTGLPKGINPEEVRTCKEHPDGAFLKSLDKRDCWFGSNLGCSKNGYCYKACGQRGSGQWCWTAERDGFGNWIRCSSADNCSPNDRCGAGGCKACGCSC